MVMTDLVMLVGTSLSMIGFWSAMNRESRIKLPAYLFFVGLAIGLLAKGPIAFVLTAIPIGLWVLLTNAWRRTWNNLPWVSGTLLMLALSLPWYLAAEIKTPGFLRYFIVGEHFQRFLESGWKGDLYGSGHARARGSIWGFWILMMMPWTPFFLTRFRRFRSITGQIRSQENRWALYLICWTLAPMLFFTLATNIIATYVISGIPACAFLVTEVWTIARKAGSAENSPAGLFFQITASFSAILLLGAFYLLGQNNPFAQPKSLRSLVKRIEALDPEPSSQTYVWGRRSYSLEFYTAGQCHMIKDPAQLEGIFESPGRDFIAVRPKDMDELPPEFAKRFERLGTYGRHFLFHEKIHTKPTVADEN